MYTGIISLLYILRFVVTYASIYKNSIYWLVLLFLFIFSAFRFEVGCDWRGYLMSLSNVKLQIEFLTGSAHEPIWALILYFMKLYNVDYFWINIISSCMFFYGANYMAQRQENKLAFLILLFPVLIINMPMSGIRQGSAIGLLLIAFVALRERSFLRYTFFVILASLFHKSAIVFLGLLPLTFGDLTKQRVLLLSIPATLAIAALLLSETFANALMRYGSSGLGEEARGGIFRTGFLALTSMHYFFFLRKPWKKYYKHDYQITLIFAWLMLTPFVLSPFSSVMGDRIGYYFVPMQVMIMTRIPYLQLSKQRLTHILYPYVISLLLFLTWISYSSLFDLCYRPYRSLLFSSGASL